MLPRCQQRLYAAVRPLYLSILASHMILSIVALPMVLTTFLPSLTGVVVFVFLKAYAYYSQCWPSLNSDHKARTTYSETTVYLSSEQCRRPRRNTGFRPGKSV